ncbi:hypothetical protein [Streptomyces sp. CBMA123]|uniref:hypothetical protein n=1 Tax=Streptomyces sp. CBMA123 TaxID=1896313 RepID=UPI001661971B|nr:hypothetical protein [Streptomyces sp. CBMA123]MBD0695084.1 hypothetical protein [Streptomyces sp. CBMA123]
MDADAGNLPALAETAAEVAIGELVDDSQALARFAFYGVDPNETLTADAADDLATARPARTSQTYAEEWRYFARWCADNGRHPGPRTSKANLVSCISRLRHRGGRDGTGAPVSSLRLAMAAARDANARAGYENWPPKKATAELIRKQAADHARARRTPESSPPVDAARTGHVRVFGKMLTQLQGDQLPRWIKAVHADDLPSLDAFANGLERDSPPSPPASHCRGAPASSKATSTGSLCGISDVKQCACISRRGSGGLGEARGCPGPGD